MVLRKSLIVLAVFGVWAAAGSPAALASGSPAVADCNAHQRLTHHYTVAQLKTALATMPANIQEYTDCYDVIQRALNAQIAGGHGGGGPGAGGPGSGSGGSGGSFLPTGVVIVLVLLGLVGATFGAVALRRRGSAGGAGGAGGA